MSRSELPGEYRKFPEHWQILAFSEAFTDGTGGQSKIKKGEYSPNGALPVIDQGQAPVGGYTDSLASRCRVPLPCILFGDHTKIFKYVDTPFALGADGVKVLVHRDDIDTRFAYYYLRQLHLPDNMGYSRHFKFLKRSFFPLPPLVEQKRIAAILDKADAVRRKRQEAIRLTEEFLRSAFLDMFGDPVTNPKRWEVKPLIELIDAGRPITYGILKPGPDITSGIPYVRVVEMKNGTVDSSIVRRTLPEIAAQYSRSTLVKGDLLLSIRGHVGRLAITPPELDGGNITQDTARLATGNRLTTEFLFAALHSPNMQHWMKLRTKGVGVKGINLGDVKRIPMPVPPLSLQKEFSAIFRRVRIHQKRGRIRGDSMDVLFNSLVQRAFQGELVSHDPADKSASKLLKGMRTAGQAPQARKAHKKRGKAPARLHQKQRISGTKEEPHAQRKPSEDTRPRVSNTTSVTTDGTARHKQRGQVFILDGS